MTSKDLDIVLRPHIFFPLWQQTFEGQLKKLQEETVVSDNERLGVDTDYDFKDMNFMDFCVLIYSERPDLIDYSQN